jgi:thiol-disulfide isomerase/thioredoxin
MQHLRFVAIFVLLVIISVQLQASALVKGVIKSAQNGQRIELYIPHFFIDNNSDTYYGSIQYDGSFSILGDVTEPQVAYLRLGDDHMPIFLEPGIELEIHSDIFQFPLRPEFIGAGAKNNELLQEWMVANPLDNNEFNNVRYKVGQWWFSIEAGINDRMLELQPADFRTWVDKIKENGFALADAFNQKNPSGCTQAFRLWYENEVVYSWAYHLIIYGTVFKNRYQIQPEFFEFIQEVPFVTDAIGSEQYRQYLVCIMARNQTKLNQPDRYFVGQFEAAPDFLTGKSLAYFQSEIIKMAFSAEQYREVLPAYQLFLQHNTYKEFEPKITNLYEKVIRIAPGTLAPDFRGHDANSGASIGLSDLSGKVVYVNFWASWCGACIKKMQVFNALAPDLKEAGVEIINISIDDNQEAWKNAMIEWPASGYHLWSKGSAQDIKTQFGVEAVPQYFIISQSGVFADKPYSNQPLEIQKRLLEIAGRR